MQESQVKEKPMVDVIIPTYNRESTIQRSVLSVLNQTYQNLQVYVIDDASTDGTEAVVRDIKDDRVHYYKCEKNRGGGACRNVGIRMAKADYIAFNDSDDVWHEDKLEKQMAVMLNPQEDIGVVFCDYTFIGENGESYDLLKKKEETNGSFSQNIHKCLLKDNFVGTPTILAKRKCLVEAGMFDETIPGLQDWELVIRLSQRYQFYCLHEPLMDAYYSKGSISTNKTGLARAIIHVMKKHYADYEANEMFSFCILRTMRMAGKAGIMKEFYAALGDIKEKEIRQKAQDIVEEEAQRLFDAEAKMRTNYGIACSWIEYQQQHGICMESLFTERNLKNIAIYGYGKFGKMLLDNLAKSGKVCIKAVIDNGEPACDYPYRVYTVDEFVKAGLPEIDAVVVTVESAFGSVCQTLGNQYRLLSLRELLQ